MLFFTEFTFLYVLVVSDIIISYKFDLLAICKVLIGVGWNHDAAKVTEDWTNILMDFLPVGK